MVFQPGKYSAYNPYAQKDTLSLINPEDFNALIRDQGIRILHQAVTRCPCFIGRVDSGQVDINCTKCENGYLPFENTNIFVYIESTLLNRQFQMMGTWDVGSAVMYSPSLKEDLKTEFYVGYFDKITVLDFLEVYSEVLQRGKGNTDYPSFPIQLIRTVQSDKRTFIWNIDFTINTDGNIQWISKNQPGFDLEKGIGEVYTVAYLRNPVYRVVEVTEENRFVLTGVRSPVKLPERLVQQCIIKKDYLISRYNRQGALVSPQQG